MKRFVYADNAATTQISPEVLEAMMPWLTEGYGNPSSIYELGRSAGFAIEDARKKAAAALGAQPNEIYFTGCGSESDNWAIKGAAHKLAAKGKKHIVTTVFEHHAVLHTCAALEKEGFEVTYLPVDERGLVTAKQVADAIRPDTALVTIMYANNEIGTIQPIPEIGELCRERGVWFHTDAVQAVGNVPIDVQAQKIDMLSLSGHKIHAPKGIGAIYAAKGSRLLPLYYGSGQERGLHPGTENTPGACAFGLAARQMWEAREENMARFRQLRERLTEKLQKMPGVCINSPPDGAPYIVNLSLPGIPSEVMIHYLERREIYVSGGSACAKGARSHVLTAMGLPVDRVDGALRVSFCRENTPGEVDEFCRQLALGLEELARK